MKGMQREGAEGSKKKKQLKAKTPVFLGFFLPIIGVSWVLLLWRESTEGVRSGFFRCLFRQARPWNLREIRCGVTRKMVFSVLVFFTVF